MTKTNPEHYEILLKGTATWNRWREEKPSVWPELMEADLSHQKLDGVNLDNANLLRANLESASLGDARLRNANLKESILKRADLARADLEEANLYGADLLEANMVRANLVQANLVKARIDRTKLSFATFGETSFDHNLVLGGLGIELIFHAKPAILDVQVFERTGSVRGNRQREQQIKWFFQNAGVTERIVKAALDSVAPPQRWSSCFVSYSHQNRTFVERLCSELSSLGITYFRDDEQLRYGESLDDRTASEVIRADRTLLCCSWQSLWSKWVIQEAEVALEKEEKQERPILIPLDLDGCLLKDPHRTDSPPLAQKLKGRKIGDFREWEDPVAFQKSLSQLLEALRADSGLLG